MFWSALVLLTLIGGAIRWYDIDRLPSGVYPDEAMNGMDALIANRTGDYALFYPDNYGREGLFINIQALSIGLLGPTVPALKLPSVLFGALTILGVGLLARELFRSRSAGIIAAFLVATSYWAINFSRIGFRAIMMPFLLSFSFMLFFRGLRTRKFFPFALSGILFGLGLHTYVAFRLTPLILILLLPFLFLSYESFLKQFWKHALTFILFSALAAAPMAFVFLTQPDSFSSRTGAVSVLSPEVNHGNLPGTLAKTVGLALIKYNFVGDQNWRHNYPPYPVLDPIVGVFFLAGFLFSVGMLIRILRERFRTGHPDTELTVHAFLIFGFLSMLVPEFLTDEGLPHALRSIGTQPFAFLFATIPILFLFRKMSRTHGGTKVALAMSLLFMLGVSAGWNITKYFILFRNHPEQHVSFNEDYRNMAEYLVSLPEETNKYLVPASFVATQPVLYLTDGRTRNLEIVNDDTVICAPAVLIPQREDPRILENIRTKNPDAYEVRIDTEPRFRSGFTAIIIP